MAVYKIYNEESELAIIANSLAEIKKLLDVTGDELEKLYFNGYLRVGAVEVIAYR
jgi:hypothetical protein